MWILKYRQRLNESLAYIKDHASGPSVIWIGFMMLLGLSMSASLLDTYQKTISFPARDGRYQLHREILNHQAVSPYRYRLLYPVLTEVVARSPLSKPVWFNVVQEINPTGEKSQFIGDELRVYQSWYLLDFIFLFITFMVYLAFLRRFHPFLQLVGFFVLYQMFNFGLLFLHFYQPWSLIEVWLFPLGMMVWDSYTKRHKNLILAFFILILVTAITNRETGIFIAVYAVVQIYFSPSRKKMALLLPLLLLLLSINLYAILRFIIIGNTQHINTLSELWKMNSAGGAVILFRYAAKKFLDFFWIPALLGLVFTSRKYRHYQVFVLCFLPFYVIYSAWAELRTLAPIYPVLIFSCLKSFEWIASTMKHAEQE